MNCKKKKINLKKKLLNKCKTYCNKLNELLRLAKIKHEQSVLIVCNGNVNNNLNKNPKDYNNNKESIKEIVYMIITNFEITNCSNDFYSTIGQQFADKIITKKKQEINEPKKKIKTKH